MKGAWVMALLAAIALAGCGTQPANPSLAAPKLVVAARPDGNATVFVHSAFGERAYEWIAITVDNQTMVNRTSAFSVETSLTTGFYLEVAAQAGDEVYVLRARVDVFAPEERASVSLVDPQGEWPKEAESFGLPFERLLDRRAP
jgi:hypothetical protein